MIHLFQITQDGLVFVDEFFSMSLCRIGIVLGEIYTNNTMEFVCYLVT